MGDDLSPEVLKKISALEDRVVLLERKLNMVASANRRAAARKFWLRPPMWTFEQHPPRPLELASFPAAPPLAAPAPTITMVTPSYNQARYLDATIDSVLSQNYPNLHYHVQDGGSKDATVELLKARDNAISWRSEPDDGQSQAINRGFAGSDGDVMAYLNSDDLLLPGTLAYVANFFHRRTDVDIVYGHRVFIDMDGLEIGRAVLPAHEPQTLRYADYIPQETMFWRRRVWEAVGPIDESFHYAMDWDFILRAQEKGFRFLRLPRFLACFRVHDQQKTAATYAIGMAEMSRLRERSLGFLPNHIEIRRAIFPYVARQTAYHWAFRLGLLRY